MIQNSTQKIIADAAENLFETHSIDSISVQNIVEACGTTRTTFYRYFKDKYDVMNWVYSRGADQIIQKYLDANSIDDMVIELLSYIKEKSKYFRTLTKYSGQNSFYNFFTKYGIDFYEQKIKSVEKTDTVSEQLHILVEGYCYGTGTIVTKWIEKGCDKEIKVMADSIRELCPNKLIPYLY